MTDLDVVVALAATLLLLVVMAVTVTFLARVARFVEYRRRYPHAPAGRVWSHVR